MQVRGSLVVQGSATWVSQPASVFRASRKTGWPRALQEECSCSVSLHQLTWDPQNPTPHSPILPSSPVLTPPPCQHFPGRLMNGGHPEICFPYQPGETKCVDACIIKVLKFAKVKGNGNSLWPKYESYLTLCVWIIPTSLYSQPPSGVGTSAHWVSGSSHIHNS